MGGGNSTLCTLCCVHQTVQDGNISVSEDGARTLLWVGFEEADDVLLCYILLLKEQRDKPPHKKVGLLLMGV